MRTSGLPAPSIRGLVYLADKYQLGVEAIIPVNRASGEDIGVIGNVHFFLEDSLSCSVGRPLFGPPGSEKR